MPHLVPAMPARTSYEQTILAIWSDVLGCSGFGVDDDFFELGGHSLLAPKVVSRIRKTLGVQIPVLDFFKMPTVAALAAEVAAQIAQRTAAGTAGSPAPSMVERRRPDADPVLSFDQQRLWLENQVLPGSAYNVHGRRRLTGALDVASFQASIRAILRRHEALRTRFPEVDGSARQIVDDLEEHWLPDYEDLTHLPEPDRLPAACRLADAQAAAPFDLAAGPLFRCLLIRLSDTDHVLSVTMHHIVADAWSIGLFVRELIALYQAGGDAERAGLPDLPVQYRDYAVWQRERYSGETLDREVAYWRDHLDGAPPALTIPAAHRNAVARRVGGRAGAGLSAAETAALHELCRKHGVSPFMALFAAFATVLGRWSGQRDMVIGVPITGRGDTGTDAVIGFFVNTLPVRVNLTGDPTFAELLARVRQACLDAYAHSETPVDVLVERLPIVRDPRRTPLFEVLLNAIDSPEAEPISGLAVEPMQSPALPSKYELVLNAQETDGALDLGLDYNADSYEASMARALLDQLVALLHAAVDDPGKDLLDYELPQPVPPTPAQQPAQTAPPASHPTPACPDRPAVVDANGTWTYEQLAAAAEHIARRFENAEHVTIVRHPSATFAAAVLGCIQAGVTYSIIEPDNAVPSANSDITTVIDVADASADVGTSPDTFPAPSQDLPSTTARLADLPGAWAVERLALSADDRIAPLTADPGLLISAIVGTFAAGATLFLPPQSPSEHAAAPDVSTWLSDASLTVIYLTAPRLRTLSGPLPTLRCAVIDNRGDLLSHDIDILRRLSPACHLVSVYRTGHGGRPLATYRVPDDWQCATAPLRVPLGTEFPDAPAQLRHPTGRTAAVGELAELCFGEVRTGDLARRWSDGTLEFVAVSGADLAYDPAEAVAALRDVPDVEDALVIESVDADGSPMFVGYVTGPDTSQDATAIRRSLVLRLPEYLIPKHLFLLDALPRTADGEYDLGTLPKPDQDDCEPDAYVAPRTPLERQLSEIFEELLGVERVGVHDTFFDLNGFSLLATSLVSRIRRTFEVELPLREVFGAPTVAALAQQILLALGEQSDAVDLEALLDEIESAHQ